MDTRRAPYILPTLALVGLVVTGPAVAQTYGQPQYQQPQYQPAPSQYQRPDLPQYAQQPQYQQQAQPQYQQQAAPQYGQGQYGQGQYAQPQQAQQPMEEPINARQPLATRNPDPVPETMEEWQILLGGGVRYKTDYEGSDDYKVTMTPMFDIKWRDVATLNQTDGLSVNLVRGDRLRAGIIGDYNLAREQEGDIRQLDKISAGFEAGAFGELSDGPWTYRATLMKPVTGDLGGYYGDVSAMWSMQVKPDLRVKGGPILSWGNGAYMKSLFGVGYMESQRSGLKQYNPNLGLKDAGIDVYAEQDLNENWLVKGKLGFRYMLDQAADSPLVSAIGAESSFSAEMGLLRRF